MRQTHEYIDQDDNRFELVLVDQTGTTPCQGCAFRNDALGCALAPDCDLPTDKHEHSWIWIASSGRSLRQAAGRMLSQLKQTPNSIAGKHLIRGFYIGVASTGCSLPKHVRDALDNDRHEDVVEMPK